MQIACKLLIIALEFYLFIMATIYTLLDTRREKQDGTYPVVFRVVHSRLATTINSGYSVKEKDWDAVKLKIKSSCRNLGSIIQVNADIKSREAKLSGELSLLERSSQLEDITTSQLRKKLLGKEKENKLKLSFGEFARQSISGLKTEKRLGTAKAYNDALSFVLNYNDGKDVSFYQMDAAFLKKLEKRYMAKPNNHYNGLAAYMRAVRAMFNKAIVDGYTKNEYYPFRRNVQDNDKYRIRKEKTSKRAVSKEFIQKFEQYDKNMENKMYVDAKNYFLFSFYMRGMNMRDIALLKKRNIVNKHIEYRRSKTAKTYKIFLNDKAREILNYYGYEEKSKNHYLFPIIKRPFDLELMIKDVQNALSNTNKYLKHIAKDMDFDEKNLTTYVSRHSWATIADKAGIDRRIISQGLGHQDLRTTDIYIDDIVHDDVLSEADKIIIG